MNRPLDQSTAACGTWQSPISADLIVGGSVRLVQPGIDGDDIYWIESRPSEQGRSVLVKRRPDGRCTDLTPAPFNARSKVHEYGGGAYRASRGRCWFVNFEDQGIYEAPDGESPRLLTVADGRRFADLVYDAGRARLIAVCEDHRDPGEPRNYLVSIALADGGIEDFATGYDFYSSPRLSRDGQRIAWICWRHPNLPWDRTELWVADLDATGSPVAGRRVMAAEAEAAQQPVWRDDGSLLFVSDADDWWNLYCWVDDGDCGQARQITRERAELGQPAWTFCMQNYGVGENGEVVGCFVGDAVSSLRRIDTVSGRTSAIECAYGVIEHLEVDGRRAIMLAGGGDRPMAIVQVDLDTARPRVLREAHELPVEVDDLSFPQAISYRTSDDEHAHALYYPPANQRFCVPPGEAPPLVVTCHGGPTSASTPALDLRIQYWTTRGFAVLDVNYRGSTGYGRKYRQSLYGRWGLADVDDCVYGALHLSRQGLADADRLVIRGGSAGGYTTLCALTFHDTFRAGASYFGIGELESMFAHTHKFESRYDHWLFGLNGNREEIIEARSPARHAERIDCPVIFFQGLDDKVVPPQQSEHLVEILRSKGLPVAYLAFEGEGHGFRRADTIKSCLEAELDFYATILGFGMTDRAPSIEIENFG